MAYRGRFLTSAPPGVSPRPGDEALRYASGRAALGRREQAGNQRENLANHEGGARALDQSCRDELRSGLAQRAHPGGGGRFRLAETGPCQAAAGAGPNFAEAGPPGKPACGPDGIAEVGIVGRDALREYVRGSLWVLPTLSVLVALAAGALLSSVSIGPRSPLAFQGTPDDARTLLLGITGTMVTVIALLLGLTVVALQLSSTQFSPRLLRSFLRDRPNQVVLSAFVATFAYSAAGLYTVGVSGGNRTAAFPRLAVSGAIVLLFVSLGLLVFFADHFVHSIQVDAIMNGVQRNTLAVIEGGLLAGGQEAPEVPAWAVPVTSGRSGYVQAARPGVLLPHAARHGVCLRLRPRVGEHVVAGSTLAWIWRASPGDPAPDPQAFSRVLGAGVRIGFERTLSRTPRSGSGSSSTWCARRCPRRSTIPTPRSRPSITCR